MDAKFTQADRVELYKQGTRFITTVEVGAGKAVPFFDLNADDAHHAAVLAKTWIGKHGATSAATHRIFEDGRTNLINIYDYRDVEAE